MKAFVGTIIPVVYVFGLCRSIVSVPVATSVDMTCRGPGKVYTVNLRMTSGNRMSDRDPTKTSDA